MTTMTDRLDLLDLTADIVSAFVSNNAVHAGDLPELIRAVHVSLVGITAPKPEAVPAPVLTPAVPIKKSINDDFLVCLEDGKKFKSLKRHLQSAYGMTPEDYRSKWGLARDYPMVAPGYAAKRSELAQATGLGSSRRKSAPVAAAPAPANDAVPESVEKAPAKRRGRPAKKAA